MSVFRNGASALITGGSSGIGLAVAQLCLKHGMRVAIVDINSQTLDLAKKTLAEGEVEFYQADVSKSEDWKGLKEKVEGKWGKDAPDLLMLNAGIGAKGTWGDGEYFQKVDSFMFMEDGKDGTRPYVWVGANYGLQIFDTNLFGVVNGLNAFVPGFQARKDDTPSAIIITGSKQGITNPPGNAAYNASKSAVKTLAEHLSYDLRESKTSVHLLVPGWTFTGLSGNTPGTPAQKPDGAWSPSQVASYLYQRMTDNKFYIICPDNDVSEQTDKKRMLWSVGDIVHGRQPLSRWREEYKEESEKWMKDCDVE